MGDSPLARLRAARLLQQQRAVATQPPPPNQQCHTAAASDADNDAYMQLAFEQAFSSQLQAAGAASGRLSTPQHATTTSKAALNSSRSSDELKIRAAATPASAASSAPAVAAAAAAAAAAARARSSNTGGWRTTPRNGPTPATLRVSERPLLCSAALADGSGDVVVGGSDHALYVVSPSTGRRRRVLYSKTAGHTEWVTCVCAVPGGRVLSGGTDARLWLWTGSSGTEVPGTHAGPVSKVALLPSGPQEPAGSSSSSTQPVLAASCSYDKTVKLWDVSPRTRKPRQLAVLSGHQAPVLEMAVAPAGSSALLLTGDRKGSIMAWDVAGGSSSSSCRWAAKQAHAGHVTALAWQQQPGACSSSSTGDSRPQQPLLALSGGQDGCLRVWDSRQGGCAAEQPLHAGNSGGGTGALGGIVTVSDGSGRPLVVTVGADCCLAVADPAAGYTRLHSITLPDFPYALTALASGLVAAGCGDGSVHVVDAVQGAMLYVLQAGSAAIRCLDVVVQGSAGSQWLVCSGDDGCVVSYECAV